MFTSATFENFALATVLFVIYFCTICLFLYKPKVAVKLPIFTAKDAFSPEYDPLPDKNIFVTFPAFIPIRNRQHNRTEMIFNTILITPPVPTKFNETDLQLFNIQKEGQLTDNTDYLEKVWEREQLNEAFSSVAQQEYEQVNTPLFTPAHLSYNELRKLCKVNGLTTKKNPTKDELVGIYLKFRLLTINRA